GWDIRNSGATAIDFLTSGDSARLNDPSHQGAFGHPPESFDDTVGTGAPASPQGLVPLPCPTNATAAGACHPVPSAERQGHLYGGTITGGPCTSVCGAVNGPEGDYTVNNSSSTMVITFHPTSSTAVFEYGGHIATAAVWGQGNSAGGISGSPYHGRVTALIADGQSFGVGNQDRSLKASAGVIPASLTLTQTAGTQNVCNGSSTQVTYTYTVNNTGQVAVSGSVVDDNGTPGNTADDVTVGSFNNLQPGASQPFTHTFTLTGSRTNIATATATTTQNQSTTAQATATVNGHVCTISLTKTPSQTSVCKGKSVTYTYVVTNNSDGFAWTGKLTDDTITLPAGAASFTLAPNGSQTFTASAAITGSVTNHATASGAFNDPASTSASANAQATVTGHVCTISLTKTPDKTSVCNGTSVTYTYVVTNHSDAFTRTGSLTDDTITLP